MAVARIGGRGHGLRIPGLEAGGLVEPDSPLDVAGDHAVEGQHVVHIPRAANARLKATRCPSRPVSASVPSTSQRRARITAFPRIEYALRRKKADSPRLQSMGCSPGLASCASDFACFLPSTI